MTDSIRLADPRPAVRALPSRSAVIVRHYDDPDRGGLARELIALCRPRHIPVLVAGDVRLALDLGADGLHLPEAMLAREPVGWRHRLRPGMLISTAAHSPRALARAVQASVDFVLLSPVFPSSSHPGGSGIGVLRFAAWAGRAGLPVYGLGGVNVRNARRILSSGAIGWAAIDGLSENSNVHR